MICYIPTKKRYNTKTHKLFESSGIKFLHFIEPQEIDAYNVPNKISIEKNDMGIGYVRNFMLNFAKQNNHEWVIFCDDDVNGFGIYNGKTERKDATIWHEIYQKAKQMPFELIGINYVQHAWHEKKTYSVNSKFAEVCILVNIAKIHWQYRPQFDTKEDRDFCLQAIKYGNGILRFNKYWFSCPNVGTNKGGLQDSYISKKDEIAAKKMCMEWHPFLQMTNKKGRNDIKSDIKALAKFYGRDVR